MMILNLLIAYICTDKVCHYKMFLHKKPKNIVDKVANAAPQKLSLSQFLPYLASGHIVQQNLILDNQHLDGLI